DPPGHVDPRQAERITGPVHPAGLHREGHPEPRLGHRAAGPLGVHAIGVGEGGGGTPACFSQAICSANRCGETVLLFSWSAKWWYIRTTRPGSSAGPEAAGPAVATAGSAGTAGPAATSTAAHTTAGNRRRRMSDSKPPGSL